VAVALRPAEPEDQPFFLRVYAGTRADELAMLPWTDAQKADFAAAQFAAQSAHYEQHYTGMSAHVILVDGEAAGRLLVARWDEEIRIVDIALLPEFRGRGAGSSLLDDLMAEARDAGKRLSIHVEIHNPAMTLYRRLGFHPVGEHGVYLRMEWDPARSDQVKTAS
jgi:ribosomal protein S18 acetylase RimI-like enzyme